jgi:hypothetical protein
MCILITKKDRSSGNPVEIGVGKKAACRYYRKSPAATAVSKTSAGKLLHHQKKTKAQSHKTSGI